MDRKFLPMKNRRVYLSGPMRGKPYFNADAFLEAEAAIADGCDGDVEIINPVVLDRRDFDFDPSNLPASWDWNRLPSSLPGLRILAMRDVREITACNVIVMLPGWELSKGATAEFYFANWLGLEIFDWPELDRLTPDMPEIIPDEDPDQPADVERPGIPGIDAEEFTTGCLRMSEQARKELAQIAAGLADHSPADMREFDSGAVRSSDADGEAWHLISPIGLRRVAETCREGQRKYSAYNWEKGMPIDEILNHAIRHIFKYLEGDRSEDHLAHTAWNLLAAMHSEELWPNLNAGKLREKGCVAP